MSVTRNAGDGRRGTRTREDIIEALQLYAELYEGDFTQAAFSPSAAKWNDRPELIERYYDGRPDGLRWPSLNAIKSQFGGSFNRAREAAGLPANSPGPARNRRPAGQHQPVRDVRERLVYVSDEKLNRATRDRRFAQERADRAQERSRLLAGEVADLRHELARLRRAKPGVVERVVREPAPRPEVRTKTKTVTKTVKVKDERALERLRTQLADERAAFRALRDQARAGDRERDKALSAGEEARALLIESEREQLRLARELDTTSDRLVSVQSLVSRLREEREEALSRDAGAVEAAAISDLVRAAELRAEQAEMRAARAEREALEHAAAMTGQARKLTADELDAYRANGPAGPQLMAAALKRLAVARKTGGGVDAALAEVAKAAVGWRDRLR